MSMRFFKIEEFDCNQTGENEMDADFLEMIDELRDRCGFPFRVMSGYRSPQHTIEAKKPGGPGYHAKGKAADIRVSSGIQRGLIVRNALALGFNGIGVAHTYIHVDTRPAPLMIWTY